MFYSIGSAPINLELNQNDIDMITASWTPPPAPPSNGYRITVDSEDFSAGIDTMSSSQTISVSPGVHTIRVQSRSIHFPGEIAARNITVLGINVTNNNILLATTICLSKASLTL